MWHSLRYYRHSDLVIYMSKLPAPSVSMPCDYRILQSLTKGQVKLVLFETVQRSHRKKSKILMGALWGRIKSTKSLISGENIDEP